MKAVVQDPNALVGKFFYQASEMTVWEVQEVGKLGVQTQQIFDDGLPHGPETFITWAALQRFYTILVGVDEIDDGKLVRPSA